MWLARTNNFSLDLKTPWLPRRLMMIPPSETPRRRVIPRLVPGQLLRWRRTSINIYTAQILFWGPPRSASRSETESSKVGVTNYHGACQWDLLWLYNMELLHIIKSQLRTILWERILIQKIRRECRYKSCPATFHVSRSSCRLVCWVSCLNFKFYHRITWNINY